MPIAFGGTLGAAGGSAEATTITVTTTAAVPAGGRIILGVGWYNTVTPSASGGGLTWTLDHQHNRAADTGYRSALLSAHAPSGLASGTVLTVTFSGAGAFARSVLASYFTGIADSNFKDVSGGADGSANPWSAGSAATTNADDVLVGHCWIDFRNTTSTPDAGDTEIHDFYNSANNSTNTMTYRIVSATGTLDLGGTWASDGQPWQGAMVAYKAASSVAVRSAGTLAASANNVANPTNLTPGLPATRLNNDVMLLFTSCRSATPTVATPSGWTSLMNVTGTNGRLALFGRIVDGNETAPTVTWSGMTTGTSGTPALARILCWSGLLADLANIVDVLGAVSNQAASTTVAAGGAAITTAQADSAVMVFSSRLDDVGTWATLAASDGVTWAQAVATGVTTSGADMAHEWQWGSKATAGAVAAKSFSLSGASSFASSGVMIALKKAAIAPIEKTGGASSAGVGGGPLSAVVTTVVRAGGGKVGVAPSYREAVLADAPFGYWPDAVAGPIANVGSGAPSLALGANTTPDLVGPLGANDTRAFETDGSPGTNYGAATVALDLSAESLVTFEFWYHPADGGYTGGNNDGGPAGGAFGDDGVNEAEGWYHSLTFQAIGAVQNGSYVLAANQGTPSAGWHLWAFVIDRGGVNPFALVYLDGALWTTVAKVGSAAGNFGNQTLYLGKHPGHVASRRGRFAHPAIYKAGLSAERIAAHYAARNEVGGPSGMVGGAAKKVEYADAGGARAAALGGGPQVLSLGSTETGGAALADLAGGSKVTETGRSGGAARPGVAGGPKVAEAGREGGAASPGAGGGPAKPQAAKTGGATTAESGGGPKSVGQSSTETGGAVAPASGGGPSETTLSAGETGGATLAASAGGAEALLIAKPGGGSLPAVGGGAQSVIAPAGGETGGARMGTVGGGESQVTEPGGPVGSPSFGGDTGYLRAVADAGKLFRLDRTAGTANNRGTTTGHGTGGATTRRLDPTLAASTSVGTAVPAPGTAPSGTGWRVALADMGAHPKIVRTIAAGTWAFTIPILASTAQVSADTTLTAILYRTGAVGAAEIGRGSVALAVGVTETTATVSIAGVAAQTFDWNDETFQVEVYATAPGVAIIGQTLTFPLEWATTQARVVLPDVVRTAFTKRNGSVTPASGGGARKTEKQMLVAAGAVSPLAASGLRKADYADTGGALATASAGGSKTLQAARPGGAALLGVGGATKQAQSVRAGGAVLLGVGGGLGQRQVVKSGGADVEQAVGGGPKKVEYADTGGAVVLLRAGGGKVALVARVGGGSAPGVGGGGQRVQVVRAGGARLLGVGGGALVVLLTKAGGADIEQSVGGGPKKVDYADTGGAVLLGRAGGVQATQVVRLGGGSAPRVGGGSKVAQSVRAGGAAAPGAAGAEKDLLIAKLGGAVLLGRAGGVQAAQVVKGGGGASAGSAGATYAVYTFVIKGITRDGQGNVVVGARVACFRADTYALIVNNPIQTSDLVTGEFAFRVSNPAVDPVTYWVSMRKLGTGGAVNIHGRTDEDLQPQVELVQGG